MHMEPGMVSAAKMVFAFATATAAAGYTLKLAVADFKSHASASFALRTVLAMIGTFICFEVLPHFPVGVSEVHLILGTTLFLILGAAPTAIGLAAGLLIQSVFFAPTDLPMYFVNTTTLLMPLFVVDSMARRLIPADRPYVDCSYGDVLKLSIAFQGGIVSWVAFWAIYGQGFGADNLGQVASFGGAYMLVIIVEPVADLAALWLAKTLHRGAPSPFVTRRLHYT
ncbi:MAG: energy-coupling factor ABC transporter permease [Erythrobacter sp.]